MMDFPVGNGKLNRESDNILKQCTRIAFCSGFCNLGSFLATRNNNYYNLMPNGGIWNPIKQNNINNNPRSFGLHRLRESLKWNVALIILIKN